MLATYGGGFPVTIPIFASQSLIAGAQTAAQVAVIASQKFANGGIVDSVVNGPSHSRGGVLIEAEGGEGFLNKTSMANTNLRAMASVANVAGGGVGFSNQTPKMDIDYDLLANKLGAVINDKQVIVSENDITRVQNKVKVIEDKITF